MLLEPDRPDDEVQPEPGTTAVPDWDEVIDLLHSGAFESACQPNSHDHYVWARTIAELVSLKG